MSVQREVAQLLGHTPRLPADNGDLQRRHRALLRYAAAAVRTLCDASSRINHVAQANYVVLLLRLCFEERARARRNERKWNGLGGLSHLPLQARVVELVSTMLDTYAPRPPGSYEEPFEALCLRIEALRLLRQLNPDVLDSFADVALFDADHPTSRARVHALMLAAWIRHARSTVPAAVYEVLERARSCADQDVCSTATALLVDLT